MGILDRVLLGGEHPDPRERARREDPFVVAVQCGQAGGTCFCVSMGTGPTRGGGLRPRADRGARRRTATASSSAPAARRGGAIARAAAHTRRRAGRSRRRGPRHGARGRPEGPRARHHRHPRPALRATSSTRAGTRWPTAASRAATARWSARPASAPSVEDTTDLAGEQRRAPPALGLVLHRRLLAHPRRRGPALHAARATASG